ncbi:hypothetical protein IAD21_02220 [Abditibacteriota bacterium]|nr:hypothetical protein IAD21_02220 [Abditibacteriota bacterium]
MTGVDNLKVRLLIACCFGLGVAGVTIYLVPGGIGSYYLAFPQQQTRREIEHVARVVDEFSIKKGIPPRILNDLDSSSLVFARDMWGRPFRYSVTKGAPLIESLGRDGIRGGVGLDADISNQVPHPAEESMPLLQKLTYPLAQEMIVVALICGVMAGVSVFWGLKDEAIRSQSWRGLGIVLLVSFVMATWGAAIITFFHVPSGH